MKSTLLMFCFLCTTAALGQAIGSAVTGPSMNQTMYMTSHAQHASPQPMGREQSLLEGSGTTYAEHGERPLWEVAPPDPPAVPLGDIARALRKEHETAKKAQFVYEQ